MILDIDAAVICHVFQEYQSIHMEQIFVSMAADKTRKN